MKIIIRIVNVSVLLFIGLAVVTILTQLPEESTPSVEPTAINQAVLDRRIRVEVLNAGGVSGMAREATDVLRSVGFDVV